MSDKYGMEIKVKYDKEGFIYVEMFNCRFQGYYMGISKILLRYFSVNIVNILLNTLSFDYITYFINFDLGIISINKNGYKKIINLNKWEV